MQTSDNLRALRRDLAGRGVNMRTAIVDGANANTDVLVANLGSGDKIVSAENVSTPADLALAMAQVAYTTFYATNKLFRITMNRPTAAGLSKTYFRVAPAEVDEATHVVVESHPTVAGADRITVYAHVSSGTTIDETAAGLVTAVNLSEARKTVTASLPSGTGADAVTATDSGATGDLIGADASTASTAAQNGILLDQGPLAASVDVDEDGGTSQAVIVFTARVPGAAGNDLSVQYVDSALVTTDAPAPIVSQDGDAIEILIDSTVTVAAAIVSAVNAAMVGVTAKLGAADLDGNEVITAGAAQDLAGGRDEGRLQFTASTSGDKVRVVWYARG